MPQNGKGNKRRKNAGPQHKRSNLVISEKVRRGKLTYRVVVCGMLCGGSRDHARRIREAVCKHIDPSTLDRLRAKSIGVISIELPRNLGVTQVRCTARGPRNNALLFIGGVPPPPRITPALLQALL